MAPLQNPQTSAIAAPRIGVDKVERVLLAENHDAAYYAWRDAGVQGRTLLHVDAHHDMWRMDESEGITIANFISAALQHGMVASIVWVVPDPAWQARGPILRHAAALTRSYKDASGPVRVADDCISTVLQGRSLKIVPLSRLPAIDEPVMLDIDIDFLIIPRVVYAKEDKPGELPWCWPEELMAKFASCGIRSDLVTVVHSVEGGYTPLPWKYLGQELVDRLKTANAAGAENDGFRLMREGAEAEAAGDVRLAMSRFAEAAQHMPASAAPLYRLARLHGSKGDPQNAQKIYRAALQLDASYRTPFGSRGFAKLNGGDVSAAEREFEAVLALDPEDPYANLGLASVAAERKQWQAAKSLAEKAVALDANLLDAYRLLGRVLARLGRTQEALAAYETSLKLAHAGQKSISATIYTCTAQPRLFDPEYSRTMGEVGRLHDLRGDWTRAVQFYEMGAAGDDESAAIRLRLARVHARQRRFGKACGQLIEAGRAALRYVIRRVRYAGARLKSALAELRLGR